MPSLNKYFSFVMLVAIMSNHSTVQGSSNKTKLVHAAAAPAIKRCFPKGVCKVCIPLEKYQGAFNLKKIENIMEQSITDPEGGAFAGAVILASQEDKILYQGVFGNRCVKSKASASDRLMCEGTASMSEDAIFNLGSLTKVIVTATAVMQLEEKGKLRLDAPVKEYWPEFKWSEKITIEQLLIHTSGLPFSIPYNDIKRMEASQLPLREKLLACIEKMKHACDPDKRLAYLHDIQKTQASMQKQVLDYIKVMKPKDNRFEPGSKFVYSNIGYTILGYLVTLITGQSFDEYARENIFDPLDMKDSDFSPSARLSYDRIVPSASMEYGTFRCGLAYGSTAVLMGGVAGESGLFATARDIMRFATCLLRGGCIQSQTGSKTAKYILRPETIKKMTTIQFSQDAIRRGLGWDIYTNPAMSSWWGYELSKSAIGHAGWSGHALVIDPELKLVTIMLADRTHPGVGELDLAASRAHNRFVYNAQSEQSRNQVNQICRDITNAVAASVKQ